MLQLKILIVDQSNSIARHVGACLHELVGHAVELRRNSVQKIQLSGQQESTSWLILHMPLAQGLEALSRMKKARRSQHLSTVVVTGPATRSETLDLMKKGVSDLVLFPFRPATLMDKMTQQEDLA
ncbi:response regulator [Herbaspirillum frisingense]|uniref:response regulator n=1 Tax=Herbaspirillum frisingense TaxID=92645 RepID=UPI0016028A43|nr:response regulator [Herbaspirillum frisingense]QNB06095.1 response regulator [Herbaspirillum frisingense]